MKPCRLGNLTTLTSVEIETHNTKLWGAHKMKYSSFYKMEGLPSYMHNSETEKWNLFTKCMLASKQNHLLAGWQS